MPDDLFDEFLGCDFVVGADTKKRLKLLRNQ